MYRLIIVDDEKFIRESMLSFEWCEIGVMPVECFGEGSTALEYMRNNDVDIVITDICMPIMNGIEFIEKIKSMQNNTIVICISGYSDYEYLRACMRAGASDYILKPIDKQDLFETVERSMGEKESQKSLGDDLNDTQEEYHHYIVVAEDYIEKHYASHITLESVAECVCLNPVYLSYLFKKITGVKFSEYLNSFRMKKATELLKQSTLRIGEISAKVGYKDSRYFSEMFKKRMGMTPNEYRKYRNKNTK